MENASKALIIAGAILLSILIIGLGMTVFNNASSSVGSANMDTQEINAHNSKFLAYNGRQKGSNVITLINTIQSNNSEYSDRQISISASPNQHKCNNSATTGYGVEKAMFWLLADNATADGGGAASTISDIRGKINEKRTATFNVSFEYADNGLIDYCQFEIYRSN